MQIQHDPAGQADGDEAHQRIPLCQNCGHDIRVRIGDQTASYVDNKFQQGKENRQPAVQHQDCKYHREHEESGHPTVIAAGGEKEDWKQDQKDLDDGYDVAQRVSPAFDGIPEQTAGKDGGQGGNQGRGPHTCGQIREDHQKTDVTIEPASTDDLRTIDVTPQWQTDWTDDYLHQKDFLPIDFLFADFMP